MAQPAVPTITVGGNVEGSIVVGDNNFVVNTNHGTIIYKQAGARVQLRGSVPLPPRKPRGFIGRARELSLLESWFVAGEPAYISGTDGIGKSTLAKQVANGLAASAAPNGVLLVEGVDEAGRLLGLGDLVQRMFDALFESDPPLKVDLTTARTYLSNTHPLVLLSGAGLAGEALNRLPDLFPSAPILVETAQPPEGDTYQALALGPLEPEDALALLADRARLPLDEKSRPMLAELAGLLGNVPGALVTVGNAILNNRLIPEMTAGLLREIQPAAADPVEAALERAYRVTLPALSQPERAMLAQAAAAPGISIDRTWMESRFGDMPVANGEGLGLVTANSPRLRLAPGLRGVALEGWNDEELKEALYDRLADLLKDRWLDFDFVHDELGNLLGLLEWASATGRTKIALYLARVLDPYLTLRGLWDARSRALEILLSAAKALGDRGAEGWALHQAAVGHVGGGEVAQARALFEQARDLRLSLGDTEGAAYSQHNLDLLGAVPVPPDGTGPKGGGLSPLVRGILIGGIAVGIIAAGVFGAGAVTTFLRPAPSATPAPTTRPPSTRLPSATSRPTPTPHPTVSPTATPTPTETVTATPPSPPSLAWTLEPESIDLSPKMPPGCRFIFTAPRVRGTSDPRIVGFNAVVDRLVDQESARLQKFFAPYLDSGCNSDTYGGFWSDEYRVTTWPEDNYMDIPPMLIYGDSATYSSSDILLSVLISSAFGRGSTPYNHAINYDLNRGKELLLSDLFLPGSDYLNLLAELATRQFIGSEFFCGDPSVFAAPRPENYTTWNITYFGLRITFNLDQGTPGPCSTAVVLIPYQDLVKMLDPQGPLGKEISR